MDTRMADHASQEDTFIVIQNLTKGMMFVSTFHMYIIFLLG